MGEAAMRVDESMTEQLAGKSDSAETGAAMNDTGVAGDLVVDHPNVTGVLHELTFEDGKWRYSLVVLTDLPLNPKSPTHDTTEIDGMVRAVVAAARKNSIGYDKLCVRSA